MSEEIEKIGKKVFDIGEIVSVFEAQEGEIQQIIGKTGNGKTYEGTRRALDYLRRGYTVYTTWQLILPDVFDERKDKESLFFKTIFFRKRFYKFNFKKNWHFIDIDRPDLIEFIASLTDCVVMLDEGQDIFDSRERITKESRKTLTRTRHMRKTLIIISQRAQAVDVTARANVTYFYKCVKTVAWFWPFLPYFKVYRTEDMDQQNFPIWEEPLTGWEAELWHTGFARKYVYESYNSWYLRQGIPDSQSVDIEAFDLSLWDKIKLFFSKEKNEIVASEENLREIAESNRLRHEESMRVIKAEQDRKNKRKEKLLKEAASK